MTSTADEPGDRRGAGRGGRGLGGLALVLAACALAYFVNLGAPASAGDLAFTEGHRALPGWSMLRSGDWLVPRLYEQAYARKPPGVPWAIAASGAVFGETALAARLPSALAATAAAALAWWFARRWFGPAAGLAAGLAQALMPWMWESGRAAEIEALLILGAQLACLGAVDLLASRRAGSSAGAACVVAGSALAVLAKGPAAAMAFGGAAVAGLAFGGRPGVRTIAAVLGGPALAAAALAAWALAVGSAVRGAGGSVVTQSSGEFLWQRPAEVLALPVAAFVASLPASLALLFPFGPDARRELSGPGGAVRAELATARALAWAWLIGVGLSAAAGLGNVRYTLPSAVLLPPLAGYVAAGAFAPGGWMTRRRAAIARALCLGRPAVLAGVLAAGALVWVFAVEPGRRGTSGVAAGHELAERVAEAAGPGAVAAADGVVEARPETLWPLVARGSRVVWVPGWEDLSLEAVDVLVLRADEGLDEASVVGLRPAASGGGVWLAEDGGSAWLLDGQWSVHEYVFRVFMRSDEGRPTGTRSLKE